MIIDVLSLSSGIAAAATSGRGLIRGEAPFGLCLVVVLTHELSFKQAKSKLAAWTLDGDDHEDELRRWSVWNWLRTSIGHGPFGLAVFDLAT